MWRQRPYAKRRTIPSFFWMDRGNPRKISVTTSVIAANIQAGYRLNRSTASPRQQTAQNLAMSQTTRPFFFNPPKPQIHAIINYLKIKFEPHRKHSTISIINIKWLMWLGKQSLFTRHEVHEHTTLTKGSLLMTYTVITVLQANWTVISSALS